MSSSRLLFSRGSAHALSRSCFICSRRMVLDINILRAEKGGNPEAVKANQVKRFKDPSVIDKIIELDVEWRKKRFCVDQCNKIKNLCSSEIGRKMKAKEPQGKIDDFTIDLEKEMESLSSELLTKLNISCIKHVKQKVEEFCDTAKESVSSLENERNSLLNEIGNMLDETVPVGREEDITSVVCTFGENLHKKKYTHVDLLFMVDGVDYERGSNIAGGRGYFLKGPGVLLSQALIQLSLKILYSKGYTPMYTPFFMNKDVMQRVAQLSQFDEELYKVYTKSELKSEKIVEEKYLIATSEQPIAAFHMNEWLDPTKLPLRYAGISTCFRQEVGSHGRDTAGIFRVHQFEKIEQFCITAPEKSQEMFHEMIGNAQELCKLVGLPYRVINITSAELNNAAAIKYDLEAYFAGSDSYKELVSCSNCTDYQSRSLAIRYGQSKKVAQEPVFVHMLNATMCATTRFLCCLLETFQQDDGIAVPECLHPYLPDDMKFLKFVKPPLVEAK